MHETLTIRLDAEDRAVLEAEVVPLTRDEGLAHQSFAERGEPTSENGATSTCWALAHHVISLSLRRVDPTASRVTPKQLTSICRRIALAIGT